MTVHRMLRDAVRWGGIPKSPAEMADPPKRSATHRPIKARTADTLRTFLEATRDDELSPLWALIATTGLRRGEALGLRWSDIDLDTGRAQINQTVIAIGWNIHLGQPKTQAGRRPIALDPAKVEVLRASVRNAGAVGSRCWPCWDQLVFSDTDEVPRHPERVYQAFRRAVIRHRLPPIPLHGLRHTWATRLADGCPPACSPGTPQALEHRDHPADLLARAANHARRGRRNRRSTLHEPCRRA